MDAMEAIRQTFFQECDELLLAMEEGLIALQSGANDSETINAVFRAVHSVKGGAGAFGFDALVDFAHEFETLMDKLRSGGIAPEPALISLLLRAGDVLADHVGAVRAGSVLPEGEDETLICELRAASGSQGKSADDFDGLDFMPVQIEMAEEPAAPKGFRLRFLPLPSLYTHANEPLLILRELAGLGELSVAADVSRLPPLDAYDVQATYLEFTMELLSDRPREKVEEAFEFAAGDCEIEIVELTAIAPAPPPDEAADEPAEAFAVSAVEAVAAEHAAEPAASALHPEAPAEKSGGVKPTIRVDLDKVDRLVNLVGELVITQAMLAQRVLEAQADNSSSLANALAELEQLLRELQDSVMAIRTQPVKSVFQRMPRLVREVAAQTGKRVRLELVGEGTEVDKTVIDRLGEPLTHMIRNAVDHGLEAPDARAAAGKHEEGVVRLSAEHRGGRIVIELTDDGRGIDRVRVRQKAIEKGLIRADAPLTDEEIDNLIFLPGFSTASEVSNISGRGVGMDVVRRNVVELGGRIGIASAPGRGSRFSLTLPLTLAVLDGMVVAVGDQTFVLPLTHIVESLRPKPEDVRVFGRRRSLLMIRGSHVPLVRTGELLGVQGAQNDPAKGVVILVESEGAGRLALTVDAIIGQQQVVIKSFEGNYERIEGIAGATILGDGRVALILDVDGMVTRCRSEAMAAQTQDIHVATGT